MNTFSQSGQGAEPVLLMAMLTSSCRTEDDNSVFVHMLAYKSRIIRFGVRYLRTRVSSASHLTRVVAEIRSHMARLARALMTLSTESEAGECVDLVENTAEEGECRICLQAGSRPGHSGRMIEGFCSCR